ncbi:hypothetical protein Goklo_020203 [Gossypium klotzschianum]|uniref:Uncharacterized protein n=1 Tax=Gossypium klotzschianum TaxID=34286 RepID=A0A7J8UR89_9ROSI|nr:hypothetical protein [Gossypium klotzschianum]
MANKLVAVYILVSIVVVAATMWVSPVAAEGDDNESFKSCYKECEDECKEEGTNSEMCEVKCHAKCGAEEVMIIKRVIRSQNRVIVEGKNLVKRTLSKVQVIKVVYSLLKLPFMLQMFKFLILLLGVKYLEDGTKVRVSRGIGASGSIIPRPEILKMRTTPRPTVAGPKDTPMNLVLEKTYDPKSGKGMPEL